MLLSDYFSNASPLGSIAFGLQPKKIWWPIRKFMSPVSFSLSSCPRIRSLLLEHMSSGSSPAPIPQNISGPSVTYASFHQGQIWLEGFLAGPVNGIPSWFKQQTSAEIVCTVLFRVIENQLCVWIRLCWKKTDSKQTTSLIRSSCSLVIIFFSFFALENYLSVCPVDLGWLMATTNMTVQQ